MDFHHRKLLKSDKITDEDHDSCYMCYGACPDDCNQFLLPPPLPTPSNTNHEMSTILIFMLCVLGAVFIFLIYLTVRKYRNSRRGTSAPLDDGGNFRQDFLDEDQGPVVDHPIWYIRTVGLPPTIIDSIAMFKYKKGEGLIEGSDCSVCLSEFEENEVLRLLPKCSHSFHVPCIDTWLRSHTNCPVCRAPVVVTNTSTTALENISSETRVENQMEDEGQIDDAREMSRDGNSSSVTMIDNDKVAEILSKIRCNTNITNGGIRVLSDLAEYRSKMDRELRPARRSMSMDFGSASVICQRMANLNTEKGEGYSGPVVEIVHEKQSWDQIGRRGSRNDNICRLIKSYSYGRSVQKRSISMKRSFSFSGKRSLRKQSRSQQSIVPGPTEWRERGD